MSRPNPVASHFALVKPLIDFGIAAQTGLDPSLVELVKLRASQINGCAACLVFHLNDARKHGVTDDRIILLAGWRESSYYSDRERAALAWTDALTLVHAGGAPDAAYEALKAHFTDEEQIKLTLVIGAVNAFNRLNVGFHVQHPAGTEQKAA